MLSTVVPTRRRRRHSGSLENSDHARLLARKALRNELTDPPPRPKSTPPSEERPARRRRQHSPMGDEDDNDLELGDDMEDAEESKPEEVKIPIDHEQPTYSGLSSFSSPFFFWRGVLRYESLGGYFCFRRACTGANQGRETDTSTPS
jgi:hypothetical protein